MTELPSSLAASTEQGLNLGDRAPTARSERLEEPPGALWLTDSPLEDEAAEPLEVPRARGLDEVEPSEWVALGQDGGQEGMTLPERDLPLVPHARVVEPVRHSIPVGVAKQVLTLGPVIDDLGCRDRLEDLRHVFERRPCARKRRADQHLVDERTRSVERERAGLDLVENTRQR